MLVGLRHHPLIRRDDEERGIDAAHARQHIVDEALVARHINDADFTSAREFQPREAQINRHATGLFFRQPIGVDTRKSGDEGRFAVIDVTRRTDAAHGQAQILWQGMDKASIIMSGKYRFRARTASIAQRGPARLCSWWDVARSNSRRNNGRASRRVEPCGLKAREH